MLQQESRQGSSESSNHTLAAVRLNGVYQITDHILSSLCLESCRKSHQSMRSTAYVKKQSNFNPKYSLTWDRQHAITSKSLLCVNDFSSTHVCWQLCCVPLADGSRMLRIYSHHIFLHLFCTALKPYVYLLPYAFQCLQWTRNLNLNVGFVALAMCMLMLSGRSHFKSLWCGSTGLKTIRV